MQVNRIIPNQQVGCGKSVIYHIKNIINNVSVIIDYQNLQPEKGRINMNFCKYYKKICQFLKFR